MKKDSTTKAQIILIKKSLLKKFSLTDTDIKKFQLFNYLLIIKSLTTKAIRITIYPLENRDVSKLTIKDPNNNENMFLKISEFLKKYNVIHTSGLIELDKNLLFECYLNEGLDTPELKDLKVFLDNIKSSNTSLNFEKIKFKR